ncbi:MAG TPA: 50S ribosomal protein L16 [Methanomicrobia archaeon]|nr:50S ribosomal protein L16 [Methanomicrobia archaeon]
MATLRPGRIDRRTNNPNYTRKEYVRTIPHIKITHFDMGSNESFPYEVSLLVKNDVQIRHNALEAARVAANRYIEKKRGSHGYHLKIRVYPFQILRENPMATGHKADRYGNGMRLSFGRPISRAARVKKGQKVMSLYVPEKLLREAKEALRRAAMKIPLGTSIEINKL